MQSSPGAYQPHSFWMRLNRKKLHAPEGAGVTCSDDYRAAYRTRLKPVGSAKQAWMYLVWISGSWHQKSGFKALILLCPPLAQAALPMHFGSEHLLPAGTFRKDPEPCSSCIFQQAWSRHVYPNLGWNLLTSAYLKWILCYLKQRSGNFTGNFLYT